MIKYAAVLLSLAAFFFPADAGGKVIDARVYIVPVGKTDKKVLAKLKEKLPVTFPISMKAAIDPERELPRSAYDASRAQYDAQKVVDEIAKELVLTLVNERAVIITGEDLYLPGADFVFGLADARKGVCVVSLARLGTDKPDGRLLAERAVKEAARELGRSWKVPDCPSQKCIMHPPSASADFDKERESFCYKCQIAIEGRDGSHGLIGQKFK